MLAIPGGMKLYLTMVLIYISKDKFLVSREIIFIEPLLLEVGKEDAFEMKTNCLYFRK